ncbi:hypothetical protein [Amycolatopsis sp. TNS106]|uniref:hypothetical protein n=1 Tax=Amycolatopsis sp. TNS106 TaxID=2861750 RepID=UPI001C597AEB|nr:hypothetical protein [Amycolatopsis sp. TNS106]
MDSGGDIWLREGLGWLIHPSETGRVGERPPPLMRLKGRASERSDAGRGGATMAWEIALVAVLAVVFVVRLALQLKRG